MAPDSGNTQAPEVVPIPVIKAAGAGGGDRMGSHGTGGSSQD
jgi:hypothetical protein